MAPMRRNSVFARLEASAVAQSAAVPIVGGEGDDQLAGTASDDVIDGAGGDDVLSGEGGNDILSGGTGNDLLIGGSGADMFDGGAGGESRNGATIYGDRVSFADPLATQAVIADLRNGVVSNDGFGNRETMVGMESLGDGTAFADAFFGNDGPNGLAGEAGDILYGFGGDDVFVLSSAATEIRGGMGFDRIELHSGGGFLIPDTNGDGIAETAPPMTVGWTVSLAAWTITDGYGNTGALTDVEQVIGSELGDTLTGSAGDDYLDGGPGDGNDVFDLSLGGADVAIGNGGDDYFWFAGHLMETDKVSGGAGRDVLGLWGNYSLVVGPDGFTGIDVLTLFSGRAFGATFNFFYALTLDDGNVAAGEQLIVYGKTLLADERLIFNGTAESDGTFILYGGAADDYIAAGQKNDSVVGGAGADHLWGLAGNDWIVGGEGADEIRGGVGADRFVYMSTAESTPAAFDIILDFEDSQDTIDLVAIDANTGLSGDQAFTFIGASAFSHTAGELRASASGSARIVEGDVDGDGTADFTLYVGVFQGHTMTAADFAL